MSALRQLVRLIETEGCELNIVGRTPEGVWVSLWVPDHEARFEANGEDTAAALRHLAYILKDNGL